MKLPTALVLVALCGSHCAQGAADAISVSVNLTPIFNNKGVSSASGGGNFDGQGGSYPLSQLPQQGILPYRGVNVCSNPMGGIEILIFILVLLA